MSAVQNSRKTMALMNDFGISPTPQNYQLWFSYVEGDNEDLVYCLKQHIDNREKFDDAACEKYYDIFFGEQQLSQLNRRVEELSSALAVASSGIGNINLTLKSYRKDLVTNTRLFEKNTITLDQASDKLISSTLKTSADVESSNATLLMVNKQISDLRQQVTRLTKEAYQDPLTGVANRRQFDKQLGLMIQEVKKLGTTFSLLMIDVDNFKQVNDTYGHPVGDLVLRFMGKLLTNNIKGQDLVARFGGEEFAVILPETGLDNAERLGSRICQLVASQDLRVGKKVKSLGRVTVSIGVAEFSSSDDEASLIERADNCLYAAKAQGKNRAIKKVTPPLTSAG